jgi:hypothetical protein
MGEISIRAAQVPQLGNFGAARMGESRRSTGAIFPSAVFHRAMSRVLLLSFSLFSGCVSEPGPGGAQIHVDRDHCRHPAATSADQLSRFALLCAEAFVQKNGFTSYPPFSDSTQWILNWMEYGPTRSEAVARRRNSLQDVSSGLCKRPELGAAYVVAFRNRSADTTRGRLVAIDSASFELWMMHQPGIVRGFLAQGGCISRERVIPR